MHKWLVGKEYFLFDLGGTLVDLEELNFRAFRETVQQQLGRDLSWDDYASFFAGSGSVAGFSRYIGAKKIDRSDVTQLVEQYRTIKKDVLRDDFDHAVTVKPGLFEFLTSLRENKKLVAVGTSTTSSFAVPILEQAGLRKYFDVIVTVDDVLHTKPAPDIFLLALKKLGGEGKNDQTIIFEDSWYGVKSAKNANCDLIVIHTAGKNDKVVSTEEKKIVSYAELLH